MKKSQLFTQISVPLGLAPTPVKWEDIIKAANEPAILYSAKSFWKFITSHPYFPVFYVVWVLTMLATSAPYIYGSLTECERSSWLIVGTVAAILCDVLDVPAIAIAMIASAGRTRSVLLKCLLTVMVLGKVAIVGGPRVHNPGSWRVLWGRHVNVLPFSRSH